MIGQITPEELRRALSYEAETGELFWRHRPLGDFQNRANCTRWNSIHSGRQAFLTICDGYYHGSFKGKTLKAHRVAWAIVHGAWPSEIDHINGNRLDNRIENLRVVTRKENCRNRALGPLNTSGVVGVFWSKRQRRWGAHIGIDGVSLHLGWFKEKDDAVAMRQTAEREMGFHSNHGRLS